MTTVADWRAYATQKLSIVPSGQKKAFLDAWNAIAGQQLGATLGLLPPANNVGQFVVSVPVSHK